MDYPAHQVDTVKLGHCKVTANGGPCIRDISSMMSVLYTLY